MYGFNNDVNEIIVEGIASGYKDYVRKRKELNKTMIISDAYTFMKSNHIEDRVAKLSKESLNNKKCNAGPSWKYLQFIEKNDYGNACFILKNERYFDPGNVTNGKSIITDSKEEPKKYMKPLVAINNHVDTSDKEYIITNSKGQFSLNLDTKNNDLEKTQSKKENHFYIITYNIDRETMMLDSIKVWLPVPHNNSAIEVDNLTELLRSIQAENPDYEVDESELQVLGNDNDNFDGHDIYDATVFGFEVEDDVDTTETKEE